MDYKKYYKDLKKAERLEFYDDKHEEAISLLLPYKKEIEKELESYHNPRFFKRPIDKDTYMIDAANEILSPEQIEDAPEELREYLEGDVYPLDITELENDYFTFFFILGVAYFNLGSIQNSIDCLNNAGQLNDNDSYTASYDAKCHIDEDDLEGAYVCLLSALDTAINPVEFAFAYETAACYFMKEKDPRATLAAFVLAYKYLPKPEYMEYIQMITGQKEPDEKYFSSDFLDDTLGEYFISSSFIDYSTFDKLTSCAYFANQENDIEALTYYLSFLALMDKKYEKMYKDVKVGKKVKIPEPFYTIEKTFYREITERNRRLSIDD